MCSRMFAVLTCGVLAASWLWTEAQSAPVPLQRPTIEVWTSDVSEDLKEGAVNVGYKIRNEKVAPTAQAYFGFQTRPKGPFSPAIANADHTKPIVVVGDEKKSVSFERPKALNNNSVTKSKVNWLRPDGTWAYSVEKVTEPNQRGIRTLPDLRLVIPIDPVPVDEDRVGTVEGQEALAVTLDCGGGPVIVPHVLNGANFTYNFGGVGTPGMTCIVCVKAKSPNGTVTICYEITFAPRAMQATPKKRVVEPVDADASHLNLGLKNGEVLFRYKQHKEEFGKAKCLCFMETRKGMFSPLLAKSADGAPAAVPNTKTYRQVALIQPGFLEHFTKVRAKAVYLRADGRFRYSIERTMTLGKFMEEGEPSDLEKVGPPSLRLIIPIDAVDASELRSGMTNGTLQTITVDCGSGPVNVPAGNIAVNGMNFTYHFGGMGVEGKTCIVCVTAVNSDGSTTICYEIVFN